MFDDLDAEPLGRYFVALMETVTAVLLLIPAYAWYGALLAVASMCGALLAHFWEIGFEGTYGELAIMAAVACSVPWESSGSAAETVLLPRADLTDHHG
jgi:uncharacterized membrane protein YphA (DoxX/SURF4 family)